MNPANGLKIIGLLVLLLHLVLPLPAQSPNDRLLDAYGLDQTSAAVIAPDCLHVALSNNVFVMLYEIETGRRIRLFKGHGAKVVTIAFTSDGTRLLSGAENGEVKLWDVATGEELRSFVGHASVIYNVGISDDGAKVLANSKDGSTRLWNGNTGELIKNIATSPYRSWVSLSPNGKMMTIQTNSGTVLYDTRDFATLFTTDLYGPVAFTRDCTRFAIEGYESINAWEVGTWKSLCNIWKTASATHYAITFSPNNNQLLCSLGPECCVYDIATGKELRWVINGTANNLMSPRFYDTPKGLSVMAWVAYERMVKKWDTVSSVSQSRPTIGTLAGPESFFSPDGKEYLVTSKLTGLWNVSRFYNALTRREIRMTTHPLSTYLSYLPSGKLILRGAGSGGTQVLWDPATGKQLVSTTGQISPEHISTDSTMLAAPWPPSGYVQLFSLNTGNLVRELRGHQSAVNNLRFLPNGSQILTASADETLNVWYKNTGMIARSINLNTSIPTTIKVDCTPDGRKILAWYDHKSIKIWDTATYDAISTLTLSDYVNSVQFSKDGRHLLIGARGYAKIIDASTGSEVATYPAVSSTAYVRAIFSPDNSKILAYSSGSSDGQYLIWRTPLVNAAEPDWPEYP